MRAVVAIKLFSLAIKMEISLINEHVSRVTLEEEKCSKIMIIWPDTK